jgi:hypothetical protein
MTADMTMPATCDNCGKRGDLHQMDRWPGIQTAKGYRSRWHCGRCVGLARPFRFSMDATGSTVYRGYTYGGDWNGFAEPLVTRATLLRICEYFNNSHASEGDWWKVEGDTLTITNSVYDHEQKVEACEVKVESGRKLKLWDIGLGYCWTEEEEEA